MTDDDTRDPWEKWNLTPHVPSGNVPTSVQVTDLLTSFHKPDSAPIAQLCHFFQRGRNNKSKRCDSRAVRGSRYCYKH